MQITAQNTRVGPQVPYSSWVPTFQVQSMAKQLHCETHQDRLSDCAHKCCFTLACLEPVVQQVLFVLANDQLTELHRLKGIQLATGQQSSKVHQQGRGLAWLGWHPLELFDRLPSAQSALRTTHTTVVSRITCEVSKTPVETGYETCLAWDV